MIDRNKAHCHFCGSTVGQNSDRTEELVHAVYDCPKCNVNYCDQCSASQYGEDENDADIRICLRCNGEIEKVM